MYENEINMLKRKLGLSESATLEEVGSALEKRFNDRQAVLEDRRSRNTSYTREMLNQAEASFRDANADLDNFRRMKEEIEQEEIRKQKEEEEDKYSRSYPAGDGEFATKRYLKIISDEMNLNLTDEEIDELYKKEQITKDGRTYTMEKKHEAYGYDDGPLDEFVIKSSKAKDITEPSKKPENPDSEPPKEPTPEPPKEPTPVPPKEPTPVPPKGPTPEPPEGPIPPEPPENPIPPEPPEDPIPPTKEDNKLPVVSGLQIYNRVLQEVGPIKGTKILRAENVISHLPFGRILSAPLRLFSGRKKEIKRISRAIGSVDFEKEFGISKDAAMDLMLDDCLLKGGEGRGIIQLKVNDIFLRGLTHNLTSNIDRRTSDLKAFNQQVLQKMEQLRNEQKNASPDRKAQIEVELDLLNNQMDKSISKIEKIVDQPRQVNRAREDKSYNKRDNIKGADAALRDLDSREVIGNLAAIEKQKLEAERDGDNAKAMHYQRKMNEYMDSQTAYKKGLFGKGTISIGAFESKIGKETVVTDTPYLYMKMAGAVFMASTVAALTIKRQLDMAGERIDAMNNAERDLRAQQNQYNASLQGKQNAINSQTNTHNQMVADINNTKGHVTQQASDNAVQSLMDDAGRSGITGEREASLIGNFNEQSQAYISADAANVQAAATRIGKADSFIKQNSGSSNPYQTFSDALGEKIKMQNDALSGVQRAQQAAGNYYSGGSHIVSNAGVNHATTALFEQGGQVAAYQSNTSTLEVCKDIVDSLGKINPTKLQGVNLDKLNLDFGALQQAFIESGQKPDLFPVIAEILLSANHIHDMGAQKRENKSVGGPEHKEQ